MYIILQMALSNMNNDTITRLFQMININNTSENELIKIKANYATYSKLQLIAKQMLMLKKEAENVIENYNINIDLENIECNFKKVPGSYYYIYEKNNNKILSMISPEEGIIYDKFISKVYFDYDNLFYII